MFFVSPCLNSFGKIEEFPEDKQNIQIPAKFVTKSNAQILVEKNKKKKQSKCPHKVRLNKNKKPDLSRRGIYKGHKMYIQKLNYGV
jgi:hypothetical protein